MHSTAPPFVYIMEDQKVSLNRKLRRHSHKPFIVTQVCSDLPVTYTQRAVLRGVLRTVEEERAAVQVPPYCVRVVHLRALRVGRIPCPSNTGCYMLQML